MAIRFEATEEVTPCRVVSPTHFGIGLMQGEDAFYLIIPKDDPKGPNFNALKEVIKSFRLEVTRLEKEYWQTQI